jgi:hypothetical protein
LNLEYFCREHRKTHAPVRQWRYRPYLLSGEPVEVSTQITVRFVLQH